MESETQNGSLRLTCDSKAEKKRAWMLINPAKPSGVCRHHHI